MKRIIHTGLSGAALGAWLVGMKGVSDLHAVRHKGNPFYGPDYGPDMTNMYVDRVKPPPTYVHAAADQGSVGLLGGLAVGAVQGALEEVGRQESRREALRKHYKWPSGSAREKLR